MAIREGDRVMVISGKDVGRESRVARVLPRQGRVIVEGVNTAKRHQKARGRELQAGIVDKPLDNQFVFTAFAVRIVDDRIDAGDVGRPPKPFSQFFYGNERFPRENTAVPRRYGNQRGVRYRIGVFQPIERNNVWIVTTEMIPDVDVDNFDELAACREYRHDDQ